MYVYIEMLEIFFNIFSQKLGPLTSKSSKGIPILTRLTTKIMLAKQIFEFCKWKAWINQPQQHLTSINQPKPQKFTLVFQQEQNPKQQHIQIRNTTFDNFK